MKAVKAALLLCIFALVAGGCGVSTVAQSPDAAAACPGGAQTFAIDGTYATIVASSLQDGCNEGLMPADLQGARVVKLDVATGIVTISSAQGGSVLGAGPVKCNQGALSLGPSTLNNGQCEWTSTRTLDFKATGDYQVTVNFTDDRTNVKTVAGGQCNQPASCTLKFQLTMAR